MLTLTRGQKVSLANSLSTLRVQFVVQAPQLTLDYSCFGLDAANRLSDDRYLIFYNQKQSPEKAIRLTSDSTFELDLSRLPETIDNLVFVMTVDGDGELQQIGNSSFSLYGSDGENQRFEFQGSDFRREKAVMVAEIYRRNGWRLAAVGQGFSGGLGAVLNHFGGQHIEQTEIEHKPATQQNQHQENNSIVCTRCARKASSWTELRQFDSEKGRCTQCVAEIETALDGLRGGFLSATNDGILQDAEWQEMWKQFDGKRQKITHEEALAFLLPDSIQFVERLLAMAGADGVITPATEKYIKQMLDAFGVPSDLQKPFKSRIQRFKSLSRIRSGHLPVVTTTSHILDSSEVCHLSVPATYRRITSRSTTEIPGSLLATSKRLLFTPADGADLNSKSLTILYRNILQIKESTESVYLGVTTGNGAGRYIVKDAGHVEAIVTALTLMSKRLLLGLQEVTSRYIPQDVCSAVWQRDGGKCVQCGSQNYLEFDHKIPHSLGGANTLNNVQLLCRKCNLIKGDRI